MSLTFYISGHGFGHASRDIEVLNALLDRRPDLPVLVRTPAQRWLFDLTLRRPIPVDQVETDTGIVQRDSLRLDAVKSLRRAAGFYRDFEARAAREAEVLLRSGTRLVVADIPPLACRAAALAGIPAIALGNFTWDWIYAGYPEHLGEAPDVVPTIAHAYAGAALALRLPMHGGFASIPTVRDIPFVARRSHRDPGEVRDALGLDGMVPLVLLSFGGHGLEGLDTGHLDTGGRYTIVTTGEIGLDPVARAAGFTVADDPAATRPLARRCGHIVELDERALYGRGFRYEDVVAAVDVVVTKPGYGVITECLANHTAMLYTSRGRFAEYPILLDAFPRFLRSRFISQEDLFAGRWREHLDALLGQAAPPASPRTDGADVAADAILSMLEARST